MNTSQQFIDDAITSTNSQIAMLQEEVKRMEALKKSTAQKKGIEQWVNYEFKSSSGLTEEFAQFARDYKKHIKSVLPKDSELIDFSRGHFYLSGFVKKGDKFVYFSCDDVRGKNNSWYNSVLIRTAKHNKDYTGGSNCFTTLDDFQSRVEDLLA